MTIQLLHGNCLDQLKTLPDNSVDSVVTDPPYGLSQHSPQQVIDCLTAWIAGEEYKPKGKGFMGKEWDAWVPGPEIFRECLRVLKPGGHILAFAGTRSMDLMSMSIRLAGFELRDAIGHAHDGGGAPLLAWAYGSGFPKSMDISKAIHEGGTATDAAPPLTIPSSPEAIQWNGWGTALKPAWEPIVLARKPVSEGTVAANVLAHGTGAINIDACRVGTSGARNNGNSRGTVGSNSIGVYGKAIKQDYGKGRFPANLIHDGSEEVLASFPDTGSKSKYNPNAKVVKVPNYKNQVYGRGMGGLSHTGFEDTTTSASRFFYCAKANVKDRNEGLQGFKKKPGPEIGHRSIEIGKAGGFGSDRENFHPTVKPTELMRYLCKLVTPPGGTVLDPFMGSGSTGKGAVLEGFNFIGCEMSQEYLDIARARIQFAVDKVEEAKKEEENNDKPTLF